MIAIRRLLCVILLIGMMTSATLVVAQPKESRAGRIRSAVVYYLAKFVRWEKSSVLSQSDYITTCVVGDDPLKHSILNTVAGKTADRRSFDVTFFSSQVNPKELEKCQLIFFSRESAEATLISSLTKKGLLTVCAVDEISWGTCVVQLFEENNKARLAIDNVIGKSVGIEFSAQLLDVAELRE